VKSAIIQFKGVQAWSNVNKVDVVFTPSQVGTREGSWVGTSWDGGNVRPDMFILGELGKISNLSSGVGH
jgi:hypothetical protein